METSQFEPWTFAPGSWTLARFWSFRCRLAETSHVNAVAQFPPGAGVVATMARYIMSSEQLPTPGLAENSLGRDVMSCGQLPTPGDMPRQVNLSTGPLQYPNPPVVNPPGGDNLGSGQSHILVPLEIHSPRRINLSPGQLPLLVLHTSTSRDTSI